MELKCEYNQELWCGFTKKLYTCKISFPYEVKSVNKLIESIKGYHQSGKSDNDVEAVWFDNHINDILPKGLQKIFPN